MSLENLEELYHNIDNLERLCNSLDGKIARADDEKTEEVAVQHLLNFELAKIAAHLDKLRKDVSNLELNYERSCVNQQNWNKLVNQFSRSQRSITILKEFEEESKSKAQRELHRMGFSEDDRDDYPSYP